MTDSRPVRVRFAPSPTGDVHVGGIRTALFNWLFAKHFGGKFILRIEDTDAKRFQETSLSGIIDALRWAGIQYDEGPDIGGPYGPYLQSERLVHYQQWANWLVENDMAYRAYETPDELDNINKTRKGGYDRRARSLTRDDWKRLDEEGKPYVLRFKVPLLEGETTFTDMVRGPITYKNEDIQDQVILKSDGWPTYHLAHIVDDHLMEISHIIRAEEWIPSTPLHTLIYQAFGWEMPQIAHVPVILKINGQGKMSKRDEGAAISYFIKGGYLPEALTNFLCNVGWNYGLTDEQGNEIQIFSKEQAAEVFDITKVTNTGTRFDLVKLQWLNGEYIRRMAPVELAKKLRGPLEAAGFEVNMDVLLRVTPLVQERIKLLNEVVDMAGFFFIEGDILNSTEELIPKKMTAEQTFEVLQRAHDTIKALPDLKHDTLESALRPQVEQLGLKPAQFFGAIRVAVTGRTVSPPLFESIEILGREVTLARIAHAISLLQAARSG